MSVSVGTVQISTERSVDLVLDCCAFVLVLQERNERDSDVPGIGEFFDYRGLSYLIIQGLGNSRNGG